MTLFPVKCIVGLVFIVDIQFFGMLLINVLGMVYAIARSDFLNRGVAK